MPETTYRNIDTGGIFTSSGQHIKSLEEYQSGVASGKYSGSPLDYTKAPWYSPTEEKTSDITTINTDDAISELNKNKEKLDSLGQFTGTKQEKVNGGTLYSDETGQQRFVQDEPKEEKQAKTNNLSFDEVAELFGNDFSGIKQNEDGTFTPSSSAYERIGITGLEDTEDTKLEGDLQELDNTITTLTNNFLNYNVENDPAYQGQVQNITQEYDKMRTEMSNINNSRKRSLETLGYRTGSTQYAGAVQLGIVGEEIKQGDERLGEITRQENEAKSAARQAFEKKNYEKFAQTMDALETLRTNKADELTRYNNKLAEANKLLQEQAKQEFEITKWLTDQEWKEKELNLDYAKFDKETAEFNFDISKFQEDIRQFGETNALDKLKLEIEQSDNAFDKQIKFQTLLNTIPEGQEISISGMTGVGRKSDDLTIDQQLKLEKDGYYIDNNGNVKQKLTDQIKIDAAKKEIADVNTILEHAGFNEAVGPWPLARRFFNWNEFINSNAGNFVAKVEQIISQKALTSLIEAKARGATFGALSDTEMAILTKAATELGDLRKYRDDDPTKEVIGYRTTETNFNRIMKEIQDSAQNIINYAEQERAEMGGQQISPSKIIDDYYKENPNKRQYIDSLESEGLSDEEKLEVLGISFNNGGSGTPIASGMRTDRHNNPTALMWTSGVEKFFKDKGYKVAKGDKFPEGNNYSLDMSNIDNPVEATIDYIDNYGFYYKGNQRWSHTAMSKSEWEKLSSSEKKNVVKKMYQAEGNKGLLNKYFA